MKYFSKNRRAAITPCTRCNHAVQTPKVVVKNTGAEVKIANHTPVWDYKEHVSPDNKVDGVISPVTECPETVNCNQSDSSKEINKIEKSSRVNKGQLNAMVLG
jgi:hypothetical protein